LPGLAGELILEKEPKPKGSSNSCFLFYLKIHCLFNVNAVDMRRFFDKKAKKQDDERSVFG